MHSVRRTDLTQALSDRHLVGTTVTYHSKAVFKPCVFIELDNYYLASEIYIFFKVRESI